MTSLPTWAQLGPAQVPTLTGGSLYGVNRAEGLIIEGVGKLWRAIVINEAGTQNCTHCIDKSAQKLVWEVQDIGADVSCLLAG